jgi:hypothetical protein
MPAMMMYSAEAGSTAALAVIVTSSRMHSYVAYVSSTSDGTCP